MDRNTAGRHFIRNAGESLPSRGAWIEINTFKCHKRTDCVAPLAGSVDRNLQLGGLAAAILPSLPSRGAWIEICRARQKNGSPQSLPSRGAWIEIGITFGKGGYLEVAPLAGSVDRNNEVHQFENYDNSRSPRGERG